MISVNTELFREEALRFLKTGSYCDAPVGTKDWMDYWNEQVRRINEGYQVGGVRITGDYYFYLNFTRILRVEGSEEVTANRVSASKIESFPAFWDGDYNYFWALEIARNGISLEDYKKLDLEVNIRESDLIGGKHLVVLKARGKGFSYKGGSLFARRFNIGRNQKSYAFAAEKEFLIKDGLLNKAWDTISFLDEHTAFRQPRLKDTLMEKKSGYKKITPIGDVEKGTRNEIIGVTLKNDPDKARGKRGVLGLFEEAGKFPGLLKAWEVCRPSFEQGIHTTGTMIAYGTGGTEEANYQGLEELFYHPDAYRVISFENKWDEAALGTYCSFFFPAYQNWEGFIDESGNSDNEGAKEYFLEQREIKKKAKDNKALQQYISENPFNPREAVLQADLNQFPLIDIDVHLNNIKVTRRDRIISCGVLVYNGQGEIKFKPDDTHPPVNSYIVRKGDDIHGCVQIVEAPVRINGRVPDDLYIIGHDPYANDGTTGSLGAAYVLKRTNPFSLTYHDCIVGSWIGRPPTQDAYNDTLFRLAEFYNAKIGFENNRGEVIAYAKRMRLLHYLQSEFQMLHNKELQSKTVNRSYGMHMTESRKEQGEYYIRDWLNEILSADPLEEKHIRILHTILDTGLLEELKKFNKKGNFDRVMALMVAMYHLKEKVNRPVKFSQVDSEWDSFLAAV